MHVDHWRSSGTASSEHSQSQNERSAGHHQADDDTIAGRRFEQRPLQLVRLLLHSFPAYSAGRRLVSVGTEAMVHCTEKVAAFERSSREQMCSQSISFLGLELWIVRTPVAEHRVEDAQQLPHARDHRDFEGFAALP